MITHESLLSDITKMFNSLRGLEEDCYLLDTKTVYNMETGENVIQEVQMMTFRGLLVAAKVNPFANKDQLIGSAGNTSNTHKLFIDLDTILEDDVTADAKRLYDRMGIGDVIKISSSKFNIASISPVPNIEHPVTIIVGCHYTKV